MPTLESTFFTKWSFEYQIRKLLAHLSGLQDEEIGDGTVGVVVKLAVCLLFYIVMYQS